MRIPNSNINWKIKFRKLFHLNARDRFCTHCSRRPEEGEPPQRADVSHTKFSPLHRNQRNAFGLCAAISKHIVSMNSCNEFSQSALLSCWCTSLAFLLEFLRNWWCIWGSGYLATCVRVCVVDDTAWLDLWLALLVEEARNSNSDGATMERWRASGRSSTNGIFGFSCKMH